MKLTANLIHASATHVNAVKDRELDLRDNQIPEIENLGASRDQNDTIDLSGNNLRVLENFPIMRRLRSLICANNRLARIEPLLGKYFPSLESLVLTNNAFASPADLAPLAQCPALEHLVCIDNPATRAPNYRLFLIWMCPQLRVLDFSRIKDAEREQARALFGSKGEPTETAQSILNTTASISSAPSVTTTSSLLNSSATGGVPLVRMTKEEQARIKQAIMSATSLQEVQRLENLLKAGVIPSSD